MNALPIESADWRNDFRRRIALEHSVLRTLIRWGFTESAFDIARALDSYFGELIETRQPLGTSSMRLSQQDRCFFGTTLRDEYLKTRVIPRSRLCQERLHDGLLSRFDKLADELAGFYQAHLDHRMPPAAESRAA